MPHRTRFNSATVARLQGSFYVITGLWPLLHGKSFQMVTEFKTTFWLAQVVGALLALIGAVLLVAARKAVIAPEIVLLGAGSAGLLAVADLLIVPLPESSRAYWLDCPVEIAFVVAWWSTRRDADRSPK